MILLNKSKGPCFLHVPCFTIPKLLMKELSLVKQGSLKFLLDMSNEKPALTIPRGKLLSWIFQIEKQLLGALL